MSRLQRKCLAASTITHGLVLVMFFIGSAFIPHKPPTIEAPAFEMIPLDAIVIEENFVGGGGNPNARLPEPEPQPPQPVPNPEPVRPQPEPEPEPVPPPKPVEQPKPEPVRQPAPVNDRIVPDKKPDPKPPKPKPEPIQRTFDFSGAEKRKITDRARPNTSNARESGASKAAAEQQQAVLSGIQSRIGQRIGDATEIGIPGPGGQAYVGYGILLKKVYEEAWVTPPGATEKEPVVDVEVVVARDGTVLSSRVLKRSGNGALDRSVEATLKRVRKAPPFPVGAKDDKRTFRISFNLSNKLA